MGLDWFILAIMSTMLWSIGAILIKFIRVNYIKSPIGYLVITAPVTIFGFILLLFGKFHLPSLGMTVLIFVTSIIGVFAYWMYIVSAHEEEISRIITLFSIIPLITLILATIFLKEILTLKDYVAFPLIIMGSILISVKKVKERFTLSRSFTFIFISVFLFGLQNLLLKVASEIDFVSLLIIRWVSWMVIVFAFVLVSKEVRKKTKEDFKQLNKKRFCLMYASECLGMTGLVFSYLAIQRGPVSLVTLVQATEGLFVIILAAMVSIFIPRILKEEINRKTVILKIVSAVLIIAGLYLIVM